MNGKVWEKTEIVDLLKRNDLAVAQGVVAVFNRQTADEQRVEATKEHNGIGFNGIDAGVLSSFAKQVIDWKAGRTKHSFSLSPKQLSLARKKIIKYAGQLTQIANAA